MMITSGLTQESQLDYNLCMAGKIRAKGRCPKCSGKFQGDPLLCPSCLIPPKKYYVDLHHKGYGRLRIFVDRQGHPLDSYHRATRVLESIRYEIDQHSFDPTRYVAVDLKNFLFETRVEAWYQSKLSEVKRGNLAKSYTRKLNCYINSYYLPFFKGKDVRDIRTYHIQEFYDRLPILSLKYTKNINTALEGFFNTLLRHDYITNKPSFPVITLDRKAPVWIDLDTQARLIEAIPVEDRPIFTFLSFQGLRPGEARALKVKDINFKEGSIITSRTFSDDKIIERVKSKVVKPRLINPALIPLLRELCKDKHPEAFVFLNPRTGRPYLANAIYDIWNTARRELGINITLYQATRHSLASMAVCNGAPLTAIQNVLGHTDIRTTLKYAHTNLESQKVVFTKMAKVIELRHQTVTKANNKD